MVSACIFYLIISQLFNGSSVYIFIDDFLFVFVYFNFCSLVLSSDYCLVEALLNIAFSKDFIKALGMGGSRGLLCVVVR